MKPLLTLCCAIILTGASATIDAQTYPRQPVRIIVPFSPGGGQDITTRTIARYLADVWGQSVVVDNRPGGKTLIGAGLAAGATPDGHSLIMVSVEVLINTGLIGPAAVNMQRDLTPVILVSTGIQVLATRPGSSFRTLANLIAHARDNPGKVSYGSAGFGSSSHMAAEQFALMAKINLLHVPYKGSANSIIDAVSGQIDVVFASVPSLLTMFQAGKLRPIAVGSKKRFPLLPDVATFEEAGLAGFEMSTFAGIMAPARTPPAIISRINRDVGTVLQRKDVADTMLAYGNVAMGGSPEDMVAFIQEKGVVLKRLIEVAKMSRD